VAATASQSAVQHYTLHDNTASACPTWQGHEDPNAASSSEDQAAASGPPSQEEIDAAEAAVKQWGDYIRAMKEQGMNNKSPEVGSSPKAQPAWLLCDLFRGGPPHNQQVACLPGELCSCWGAGSNEQQGLWWWSKQMA
jgi:hypothetical protein